MTFAARVALANGLKAAGRALRPSSGWEAAGALGAVATAFAFAAAELWGLRAAVALARRGLPELPGIVPAWLLERGLGGALGGAALLLVLGTLTTAVSTLFLSEELAHAVTLPIPHASLFRRQVAATLVLASSPALLLALPAVAAAALEGPRALPAAIGAGAAVLSVVVLAGVAGTVLALLLVALVPPRRALLLSASLSGLGLAAALVGARAARPERLFDPIALLELLEKVGGTPPPSPGADPIAVAARLAARAVLGSGAAALGSLALLAGAVALLLLAGAALAPLHLRLLRRSREEADAPAGRRRAGRPAASLEGILLRAELATLLRDAATPGQLGTLAAVFVLDLLNLRLLPTGDAGARDLVAGLQTGLALFLVSALSLRFAYPAVSTDGRAALVLRSLPLSPVRHLLVRWAVRAVPAVAAALLLVGASAAALRPGRDAVVASLLVALVGGAAIPALHVGLGGVLPRYDPPNPVAVALGPGGLLAMGLSTLLAVVPVAAVSDGILGLVDALARVPVERGPLLAAWTSAALALGAGALAAAARRLPRADVSGG